MKRSFLSMLILIAGCGPENAAVESAAVSCTGTQECADEALLGCVREFTSACDYQYRCDLSDQWVLEDEWGYTDAATCTEVLTDKNCGHVEADVLAGAKQYDSDKLDMCAESYESMECVDDLAGLVAVAALRACDEALQRAE